MRWKNDWILVLCVAAMLICSDRALAQEQDGSQERDGQRDGEVQGRRGQADGRGGRPGGRGGRGARGGVGRGGRGPAVDDTTGFTQIFNGESLEGWDGDPTFWRVDSGVIVGQSTAENPVQTNTFLIWKGGTNKDFELKLEAKLTGGNSGIQYRSAVNEEVGPWSLRGYQADFDAANRYSGQIYEERGRAFLAMRGQFVRIAQGGSIRQVSSLGSDEELAALYKTDDFNQFHIIARGNTILQFVNGRLYSGVIDEDEQGRAMEGVLGLQMHTGAPMTIEVRNVWYKEF